ncbi:MAG TPA: NAD(P)H-binding protein [Streptosporangiaceae bacterium]|jgi:uncharacterized protein YbjT (DUF2867 family)|nr:NAD(P)H-binding protein [Streptosporangiaceae bacterium]
MILVTGAAGNVGQELVRALLGAGEPVRALVRDQDRAVPAGAEAVTGDLNQPASLAPALADAHGLFLLSGYADMPGLLAAAGRAGVERVVLLSGGAAVATGPANPISEYMITSEDAVRRSGLAWTLLRPYEFMSNALRWAPQLQAGDAIRAPFAGVPVAVIDPHDIAAAAAAALLASGHEGQAYRLSGPQPLLPADRVRILAEVLGRRLRFEPQPDDEARAEMTASMPAAYVDAFFSFYVDGALDESQVLGTVGDLTGSAPGTFEAWASRHAGAFG